MQGHQQEQWWLQNYAHSIKSCFSDKWYRIYFDKRSGDFTTLSIEIPIIMSCMCLVVPNYVVNSCCSGVWKHCYSNSQCHLDRLVQIWWVISWTDVVHLLDNTWVSDARKGVKKPDNCCLALQICDLNLVITLPAECIAHGCVKPSAGTVLTTELGVFPSNFLWPFMILVYLFSPDNHNRNSGSHEIAPDFKS